LYKKLTILGLGNILLKDEGVGVRVVWELEKKNLPGNIELVDAGTSGLDILSFIENVDKLIIIDAVKTAKTPGTLYRLDFKSLSELSHSQKLSLHQLGILETLQIAKKIGKLPEKIIIIGIEPKEIDWGLELSPEIEKKIPDLIDLVLKEIEVEYKPVKRG